jgi:hypothetical protein
MALKDRVKRHQTWEDGVGLMLGLLIGLSPWLIQETSNGAAVENAALVGVGILLLAQLELLQARRWEEVSELVLGVWLCAAPTVLGYGTAGQLRYWHWALGAAVILLAALELWQDHSRPDQDR